MYELQRNPPFLVHYHVQYHNWNFQIGHDEDNKSCVGAAITGSSFSSSCVSDIIVLCFNRLFFVLFFCNCLSSTICDEKILDIRKKRCIGVVIREPRTNTNIQKTGFLFLCWLRVVMLGWWQYMPDCNELYVHQVRTVRYRLDQTRHFCVFFFVLHSSSSSCSKDYSSKRQE